MVLFILAVVWAVYLVSWARSRSDRRGSNSISTFTKHLSVLERTTPGWSNSPTRIAGSPAPQRATVSLARPAFAPQDFRSSGSRGSSMSPRQVRERRKNVLFALAGAVVVTFALVVVVGGSAVYLQLLADCLFGAYVFTLVQIRRTQEERQAKVRYMPQQASYREQASMQLHSSAR